MRKNRKQWLSALLALVMMLSCMPLGVMEEEKDYFAKFDPPIEITSVKSVSISGDQEDLTYNNNFFPFLEETYGIKINYLWTTTPEQYDQKLALSLATGDLPDFMTVDMQTLSQMIDAEQVIDLTELWENEVDPLSKSLLAPEGTTGMGMGSRDGKIYGIPMTTPVLETMHGLFVRTDWMEKLGLDEPTTFEEMEEIMYAFAKNDPDGNGKDDTYGIGLNKELYGSGHEITSVANAMHAYPNAWVENEEGKIEYGSVQPEMKPVLEKLHQWYEDGLIDPEFTVKSADKEAELMLQEKLGLSFGVQWLTFMAGAMNDLYMTNPEADFSFYKIPSIDDEPAMPIVYDNTRQFLVITSECENPEAVIRLLNIMHKIGAGDSSDLFPTVEDFDYVWHHWEQVPIRPESIHGNIPKWQSFYKAIEVQDRSLTEYNGNVMELYDRYMKVTENPDWRFNGDETQKTAVKNTWGNLFSGELFMTAVELDEQGLLKYEKCGALTTETMVESLAQLEKMELETFTRIITGDAPIEEFDIFVANWEKMGGAKITEEINAYYGK